MNPFTDNPLLSSRPVFAYALSKARLYVKIGRDKYRLGDAFHMPAIEWPDEVLQAVDEGMAQLVRLRGQTRETPLEGIGIDGFYALLATLHYELEQQALVGRTEQGFLDEMKMKHTVTGETMTLYNLTNGFDLGDFPEF